MDEHSPGNYGLMDIIQALKWIQRYIERFHGKKDEVNIASLQVHDLHLVLCLRHYSCFTGDAGGSRLRCSSHITAHVVAPFNVEQ